MPSSNPSRAASAAASDLANNQSSFDTWAEQVHLVTVPIEGQLPEELNRLLAADSIQYPAWLTQDDPPQFQMLPPALKKYTSLLRQRLRDTSLLRSSEDRDLSNDVVYALPFILSVVKNEYKLQDNTPEPSEADRRGAVDCLMTHAWEHWSETDHFSYRKECSLQLPRTQLPITKAKADSCVFIHMKNSTPVIEAGVIRACSCLLSSDRPTHGRVMHWASEFKRRAGAELVCTRQVMFSLVSGLYQRRALGFPNHFIFGTVHVPMENLRLLAARWVSTPQGQSIRLYRLGNFSLGSPLDMLRFFLIMRQARRIGKEYQTAIEEMDDGALRRLHDQQRSIYDWPPSQGSHTGPSGQSGMSDLTSVPEEQDMVGVVGTDMSLSLALLRTVENTDPNTKVLNYLSTLLPGEYELDHWNELEPLI